MRKIILAVGARPNLMKAAPLFDVLKKTEYSQPQIVHTGQHYDYEMSQSFFADLNLPDPAFNLEVGSGSHAKQTAKIMIGFEKILEREQPALVVVFGDVNSTIACSLAAKKMNFPVAHIEAGLRSFDKKMPEEINRKLTDCISDLLFTHCQDANDNLMKEGIEWVESWKDISHLSKKLPTTKPFAINVGNIMIDSLVKILDKIDETYEQMILKKNDISVNEISKEIKPYGLVTLHRPSNVDSDKTFFRTLDALNKISRRMKIIFPVHPRTRNRINELGIQLEWSNKFKFTKPLSYKEFITLEKNAHLVITDSGGIQEETSYLNIPCFTLRPNTERPITISHGTNKLVTLNDLADEIMTFIENERKAMNKEIPLWDGETSERISDILHLYLD